MENTGTSYLFPDLTRRGFLQALTGGAAAVLIGCDREDVRKVASKLISQEQVREFGLQTWQRIRREVPVSSKGVLQQRLQKIGTRVVQAYAGTREDWEFRVFQGDQINAFAVPGGKVGFFEGIFSAIKNDAQIAAVLGHEIGHIQANHAAERIMAAFAKQVGIAVVLAALKAGDVGFANEIAGLLGAGVEYGIIRPYSRTQEYEADRLGADIMARAGFPAQEAVNFWQNMMALGKGRPRPPALLSTHPSDEKRIAALREVLKTLG
jgi:predicted Zn-dependent protease